MANKQMLKRVFSVDEPPSLEFLTLETVSFIPNPASLSGLQGILSAIVFGELAPIPQPLYFNSLITSWFFTKEDNSFTGWLNCEEENSPSFNYFSGCVEGV